MIQSSLDQLARSNSSTMASLSCLSPIFQRRCTLSGTASFPDGFLSHSRLRRPSFAPSLAGGGWASAAWIPLGAGGGGGGCCAAILAGDGAEMVGGGVWQMVFGVGAFFICSSSSCILRLAYHQHQGPKPQPIKGQVSSYMNAVLQTKQTGSKHFSTSISTLRSSSIIFALSSSGCFPLTRFWGPGFGEIWFSFGGLRSFLLGFAALDFAEVALGAAFALALVSDSSSFVAWGMPMHLQNDHILQVHMFKVGSPSNVIAGAQCVVIKPRGRDSSSIRISIVAGRGVLSVQKVLVITYHQHTCDEPINSCCCVCSVFILELNITIMNLILLTH